MKDKIIMIIIGILIGAVLTTGAFYIYTKSNNVCSCNTQITNGQPPQMPNGQEPPEKPSGENGEMPTKPEDNNTQSNN